MMTGMKGFLSKAEKKERLLTECQAVLFLNSLELRKKEKKIHIKVSEHCSFSLITKKEQHLRRKYHIDNMVGALRGAEIHINTSRLLTQVFSAFYFY